ncbi:hypothetical protein GMW39_06755 [Pectobacterium parmentieri]|uniref:hypothetical protein n=1 Tax=Pectobacterium parmentieri TaxID=1905730 RepID=UPI001374178F|nr:hypothetical protein [Pectobacterium parmentieri]QHQ15589.1 hypothetical protein GMW39_06755 [Pectobacterium parmentieri]
MSNLKNILDVCDIFISGSFVELRKTDFYPHCEIGLLVIKKMIFGCEENYSVLVAAADWGYVTNLNFVSGEVICVPVFMDFDFDISCPLIWLSDRCGITKK